MLENINTEFKREYTDKVNKTLLAFLNTDGGKLYIGIDDDGVVCGVDNADGLMQKVTNSFRDSVSPDPMGYYSIAPLLRDGKTIVEVSIERGTMIPYCFKSIGLVPQGVYVRTGNESVPASREHIRQLIRENSGDKFPDALSIEQNLTFNYAESIFSEKDVLFGDSQKRTLGIIRSDGRYSNLALLLSDQCPYTIKAAIFQGTTKAIFKDRKEFSGSLLKQLDDCLAYMNVYNKIESKFESIYRVDNPDYPDIVLREALMNAIIHRDYYIEGSILVSLYDNRIEIMSIGGTMPGVTKELMIAGVSIPRNERLANVFLRLNLIEAYGTGIPRIFEAYAKHGLTPDIPITNGGFLISLPNMNAGKQRSTSRQKQIILEAFPKNEFTKEEAANATEMSVSGCYKLLQRMVEHGLLTVKRVGHGFRYRVVSGE